MQAVAPEPIRVGDLTVQPFIDGVAVLGPSMFVAGGEPVDWSNHADLLDEDGNLPVPVGAFLVRTGERTVLIDAGVGVTKDPMFHGHELIENMTAAGVPPGSIDTVVVTHLHSDHCGWLATDEGSTFPNATIHLGPGDWQMFAVEAAGGRKLAGRLRSIENQVEPIDRDGVNIAPGITTRATPGHTPGHQSVVISSGTERLLMLGDALHCPAQLTESEWRFFYDVDKDLAARTREALLREADDPNTALLPAHFPGLTAARLVPATGKKRWVLGP
jgi:glyoxylase-like metal-dependent hydrolase (beta-lactamase superfamily II)